MNDHVLKSCPFCGSGDVRVVEFLDGEGDRVFAVGCEGCGCNGTPHIPLMDDARPAAIASWQRRALSPVPEGYVSERSVLVAATRLRKLASGATPMARSAYIKAAEMVEMAVIASCPAAPECGVVTLVSKDEAQQLSSQRVARMRGGE